MSESKSSTVRNPAIECYRVLLMCLIVLHHAAYHGHWDHAQGLDASYPSLYWMFTLFVIWHVDGFVAITGWFGVRFSLVRFVKLWGVIAFYSVFSVAYGYLSRGRISSSDLAGGWFGQSYLFFLFLTPLLNAGIDKITSGDRKTAGVVWGIFNVAIALNWLPYHFLSFVCGNGFDSYTIMTLIAVYVNVRFIRLMEWHRKISKGHLLLAGVLFVLSTVGLQLYRPSCICYHSPFVMAMAVAGLIAFFRLKRVPPKLCRVVTAISPLMFGVYIIHMTTSFGRLIYQVPQKWMAGFCAWHPALIVVITASFCFVACVAIEFVRRFACSKVSDELLHKISLIDIRLGLK